ncbi:MAG: hypothetical protein LC800_21665 [Acidobacteria bacterium]|nr:hypothetical protein [Acidobacteriota bacterium]
MAENENAQAAGAAGDTAAGDTAAEAAPQAEAAAEPAAEITYHAVEKDGQVSAIWEMQGRKHVRTIDPRSRQGQEILRLYTSEHEHQ